MTHDQRCTFDPKYCRDCQLQAEARADERELAAWRVVVALGSSSWWPRKGTFVDRALRAARGDGE